MLHIYYGMGKGKTSALNGSAIRAKGANFKVAYYRFLKGRPSSENIIMQNIVDDFKSFQSSTKFVIEMNDAERKTTKQEFLQGFKYIQLHADNYQVICIDEIIDLIDKTVNLITKKELIDFLLSLKNKEILISGHSIFPELEEVADLITFFKCEKHYFNKGIKARKGIEF